MGRLRIELAPEPWISAGLRNRTHLVSLSIAAAFRVLRKGTRSCRRTQHHRAMRATSRAYGCGTAKRRYRHRLPSPPRASNGFLIRSSPLCEEVDGWRCLAGWRLRCLRSCCARRRQTTQRRRILRWRSNHSHRPPMRTQSFPLLPSTSPHLGSSTRTPRSIRRKCRPRRLPQEQSTDWRKRRRTTHQREPRVKPTHSLAEAHHSSSMECSRLRSRWFRAMAVTELAQQDVSRTDYRAHFRLDTYRPAALFSTPSRPFRRGFQRALQPIFEILGAPRVIRMGPLVANIDGAHLTRRDRERGPSARLRRAPCDKNKV